MNSLMLYRADHLEFDVDQLARDLLSCPVVTQVRSQQSDCCILCVEFTMAGETLTAYLSDTGKAFYIDSCSDEAIAAMLEIQERVGSSVRLCDTSYTFDILLNPQQEKEVIKRRMIASEYDA